MDYHGHVWTICLVCVLLKEAYASNNNHLLIEQGASTNLTCERRMGDTWTPVWKINEQYILTTQKNVHVSLNEKLSSLYIYNFTKRNEGNYSCFINTNLEASYYLESQDSCLLHFTINGESFEDYDYIVAMETYTISCRASSNCSSGTTVSLTIANSVYDGVKETTRFTGIKEVSSIATYLVNTTRSYMHCQSRGGLHENAYDVYVTPELEILLNDAKTSGTLLTEIGKTLNFKCVAYGSRPNSTLTWTIEGNTSKINVTETECNSRNEYHLSTKDCESKLTVVVENDLHVSCNSLGLSNYLNKNVTIAVTILPLSRMVTYAITFGLSFVAVLIITISCKGRRRGRKHTNHNPSAFLECTNEFSSMAVEKTTAVRETDAKNAPYSRVNKRQKIKKKITRDTQSLTTLLSSGNVFDYWKASIGDGSDKQFIVAKTESAELNDGHVVESIVACLRRLDKHQNIVELLGCSTDAVPCYIYQEYIENGILRDYLVKSHEMAMKNDSTEALRQRHQQYLMFAKEVASGLVYLHSNEFCHPAIATRKVLLTNNMTCKLFDVWPLELYFIAINNAKKRKESFAWLPPEVILLDQYNYLSDVWSFGVFLWETFSFGEVPYQHKQPQEITNKIKNMECLERPPICPEIVYNIMLSTWSKTCEKRPQMQDVERRVIEASNVMEDISIYEQDQYMQPNDNANKGTTGGREAYSNASNVTADASIYDQDQYLQIIDN